MNATRSLYPSIRKAVSAFAIVVSISLTSGCGNSTPSAATLADSSANGLGPGLAPGASNSPIDPTMVQSGGAPALTGSGVPTSAAQAAAAGLSPNQVPSNFDYGSLISAWANQWQNKPSPFNPSSLPSSIQQLLQSLYCSTYGQYGSSNDRLYALIMGFYLDVLHRFGDYAGVQAWMAATNIYDQSSRQNSALGFINSDEGNRNFIDRAYYGYLRRAPSAAEENAWLNNIKAGTGAELEDMYSYFVSSDEYFNAGYAGKGNVSSWVTAMYRDVLGRVAQPWEVQFWVNQYNVQGGNRFNMAKGFLYSDENYLKFITNSYLFYLNRFPSGTELQSGLAQMRAGVHMRLFMAQLMGTQRYLDLQPPRFGIFTNPGSCSH